MLRNSIPLTWVFLNFLFTAALCLGEEPPARPAADRERLDVSRSWSERGGRIDSQQTVGETKVLHGLQVVVGPNNWLKEISVYNLGALEQRCQFYPSGRTFREMRREHNGDGDEVIYSPQPDKVVVEKAIVAGGADIGPIKIQSIICQGHIKAGRRWSGSFLVPVQHEFATKLMLQEYEDGTLRTSAPFPVARLALNKEQTDFDGWLWDFPDWPVPMQR